MIRTAGQQTGSWRLTDATRRRPLDLADRIGLGLGASLIAWMLASAGANGGSPLAPCLTVIACGASIIVARKVAATRPEAVPASIAGLAATFALLGPVDTFGGGAGSGLFGYANAKAAFYVLAAVAAVMIAVLHRRTGVRVTAVAAAVAFVLVPISADARAATAVVAVALLAVFPAIRGRAHRALVSFAASAVVAAVLVTTLVAIMDGGGSLERFLGSRRVRLWREAADMMTARPILGVGPGRFDVESPTARSDSDLGWAHHEFLHMGAETGVAGFLLLLLTFMWGFVRIATGGALPGTRSLAAIGLGALGVLASSDYVLHFPLVPLSAALLVGAAVPARVAAGRTTWRPGGLTRKAVKVAALSGGVFSHRRPGDLLILLYHRVGAGDREIDLPSSLFEEQMAALAEREELRAFDDALRDGRGGVVATFDDGYRDFHEHVLPVLVRHRIPAVLYLATGLVDGRPQSLTWTQLEESVDTGLVKVGAHTHSHADLSRVGEREAEEEMRRSQRLVEDRLGVPCRHFAYPWAVGSPAAQRAARRLFDSAALEAWRTNRRGRIDLYRLGRTPVFRSDGPFFFGAKADGRLDLEGLAYRVFGRGPWRVG